MISNAKQSEMIAIKGLQYLAGDEEQLERFLALSGCEPASLRDSANSTEFLSGILEYFMSNEATLLAFCAQYSINPEDIAGAQHRLDGSFDDDKGEFET